MSIYKREKLVEEIRRQAGEFIAAEAARETLITPTRVTLSPDMKKATVFVSVYPETGEDSAFHFLRRKRTDFKHYVMKHTRIGRVPQFDFAIDIGEKNRLVIEDLSKKLDDKK
tara:strand:+ start:211 stop:549 length:339 start_codon:yes stop_codon:yes gene_type:complete